MNTVLTVIATAIVTAFLVATFLYFRVISPLRLQRNRLVRDLKEIGIELSEERQLRTDLVTWIEVECFKFKFIEKALKQRVKERLEVMRQLRISRQQLTS